MFCTACATFNPAATQRCRACGAGITPASKAPVHQHQSPLGMSGPTSRRTYGVRRRVARALYILPLVVLVLAGSFGVSRYRADQSAAAAAYARAAVALEAGEIEVAIDAFTEAGGYRDADERRAEAVDDLAPYRATYLDGVAALDAGRHEDAIAALLLVARDLPGYENAAALLAEARQRREDALLQQADIAEAHRDWLAADRALATLLALDPENEPLATRLTDLRRDHAPLVYSWEGALYLIGPDLADERLLTDEVLVSFPTWSPDRSRIAFLSPEPDDYSGRTSLYVIDANGANLTYLTGDVAIDGWPAWSPDGSRIAVTAYTASTSAGRRREPTAIQLVDLATKNITTLTGADMSYVLSPTWSPAGDRLAFVVKRDYNRQSEGTTQRQDGDVYVLHLPTGQMTNVTNHRVRNADDVTWSPGGRHLLIFAVDRGTPWYERALTSIFLLDLTTGATEEIGNQSQGVGLPYWSPDGHAFAFTEGDQTVRIRWVDRDEDEAWVTVPRQVASILVWAPESNALIAVANDPKQASTLIPLDDGPGAAIDFQLNFDLAAPWLGPPQWSPANPLTPLGQPTISGTGMDPR